MTVSKVEIERLSVISSKSFEEVLATLEASVGHRVANVAKPTAHTFAEFESVVHKQLGATGLMMFMKFDQGAVLRKERSNSDWCQICSHNDLHPFPLS